MNNDIPSAEALTFWLLLGQAKSDIPIGYKPKVTR